MVLQEYLYEEKTVESIVQIAIQINGKLRGTINIPKNLSKEETEKKAMENDNVIKFTEGKEIVKVIVIPGKIVNIVVK